MTRTIIIDDEPLARSLVREYLAAAGSFEIVAECGDGFDGVKAIAQHKPDLVFLDIQMPKINGFEMLELLESPPPIIFTTAFDEYAIRAFELHAVDYLLKPFSHERFSKALEAWKSRVRKPVSETEKLLEEVTPPEERQRLVVKKGSNIVIIPVATIHYLEAFDDYVKIHTKDGFYLKKKTLTHYEKALDQAQFVRIHRSYMINLQELTRIEPLEKETYVALLKGGQRLPMSQAGYGRLKVVLGE